MENLPSKWSDIQPNTIYCTTNGLLVSFSLNQIEQGTRFDNQNKHLKAIMKGIVAPRGNMGLVPSELAEYDFKSKVLGKGGDRRFHAQMINNILHFPGYYTEH